MGEATLTVHKQRDRVSVSYDRTINVGNYESIKIHAGYSTDVMKDESVEEAFDRAENEASTQLEKLAAPIEDARGGQTKKTKGR